MTRAVEGLQAPYTGRGPHHLLRAAGLPSVRCWTCDSIGYPSHLGLQPAEPSLHSAVSRSFIGLPNRCYLSARWVCVCVCVCVFVCNDLFMKHHSPTVTMPFLDKAGS